MDFSVYGVGIIPVIVALVEVFKKVGLPVRFAPLASLLLGIVSGFVYLAPDDPPKAVLYGIVAGLSAVGLFSGTRATCNGKKSGIEQQARK